MSDTVPMGPSGLAIFKTRAGLFAIASTAGPWAVLAFFPVYVNHRDRESPFPTWIMPASIAIAIAGALGLLVSVFALPFIVKSARRAWSMFVLFVVLVTIMSAIGVAPYALGAYDAWVSRPAGRP